MPNIVDLYPLHRKLFFYTPREHLSIIAFPCIQYGKNIDPCMGSGHILVYAFDILIQIYKECGVSERDAAQSILQNNLYGLDIDDRAAQLAYFAVMMKARQYDRRIFTRGIQPNVYSIVESNKVVSGQWSEISAQSSPLVEYFANGDTKLEHDLCSILREFCDAKEYGSILNITPVDFAALYARVEEVRGDISLFREMVLNDVEPLIRVAEIMAQKYDVVVTNPPYMGNSGMSVKLSDFVKNAYPHSKTDLFACFIEKGNSMVSRYGINCMVTMQSWMFLTSFEKMRTTILHNKDIINLMHMENMVMGIAFGTAVSVFRHSHIENYKGTFNHIKYEDIVDDQPKQFPIPGNRFAQVSTTNFSSIPGSPVAYWANPHLGEIFVLEKNIGAIADVRIGMGTGNNDLFLREWWEVSHNRIGFGCKDVFGADISNKKYFPYGKGGECRRWYGNQDKVVWYDELGRIEMKNTSGHRENGGMDRYFQPSITWSYNTSGAFNARSMPTGFVFDVNGSSVFANDKDAGYILAFLTSVVCRYILSITNSTITTQAGNIRDLPIIFGNKERVSKLADWCINSERNDWDSFETSWDFTRHPLV